MTVPKAPTSDPHTQTINAGAHVNAFIKPRAIVPIQDLTYTEMVQGTPTQKMAKTTSDLINKVGVTLLINTDGDPSFSKAEGSILIDDGLSRSAMENQEYDYYTFSFGYNELHSTWANKDGKGGLKDRKVAQNTIDKFVLLNSGNKAYTWGCWTDENHQILNQVTMTKDATANTWTFTPNQGD